MGKAFGPEGSEGLLDAFYEAGGGLNLSHSLVERKETCADREILVGNFIDTSNNYQGGHNT